MLTKAQFEQYAVNEIMWCIAKKENSSDLQRLETKLFAYDEILCCTEDFRTSRENSVHIDIISDIAQLCERYGLELVFFQNKGILYEWSVNYTKTCIENDLRPSSLAAARFIKRLHPQDPD